jgi:hypothetical protein
VRKVLVDFNAGSEVIFDCSVALENGRVVSFQSPAEVETLPEADESHPELVAAIWTYFHSIEWKRFAIRVPYKIEVTYATNPRREIVGAMTFAVAPQQIITLHLQGPQRLIQSMNDELDAVARSTFLPNWWRLPKRALQYLEPYLGFAIYGATISTVFVGFSNYERWTGKPLIAEKTDQQLRTEIIKDRADYLKAVKEYNEYQERVLRAVQAAKDPAKKLDIYLAYELRPLQPRQFTPIDELFKRSNVLPVLGYMFLAFVVAGLIHMALLQVYKRLTPPSVIAVGRLGRRRLNQYRIYDWTAVTLIGVVLLPLIASVGHTIYRFFQR